MNTDAASSARWSMSLPMRALWWMEKLICLRSTPSHLTPTPTAIIKVTERVGEAFRDGLKLKKVRYAEKGAFA